MLLAPTHILKAAVGHKLHYVTGSSLPGTCAQGSTISIQLLHGLERGRERDRETETSTRQKHRPAASCTPPTRDAPATNAHALDRNRTWDPSVRRPTLYPLSQT
ncbi:hypothetical protein QTO34_002067, partial [Cnephaeus nilssonii]